MKRTVIALLIIAIAAANLFSEAPSKKIYNARLINPTPPKIDGILDDNIWQNGIWASGFVQSEPYDGADPSQETEFKIFYDEDNIYVAFRIHDNEPDKIERRMTRRDGMDGDDIRIWFDSYNDNRTAFEFVLTSAGVKADAIASNDGHRYDFNWDPVWYGEVHHNESGWTAEMKIPLNQLRFSDSDEQTWGLQVGRMLYRKRELSYWQHIPKDTAGWISRFGELQGIKGLRKSRRVEIMPYSVAKTESYRAEAGNPFMDGRDNSLLGGLDAKVGLTSNLTVDLTINPDFGQVEADPSEVNLTAYETFFEEKRPFFIEGKNIFNYNITGGDGDFSRDNVFYSRRIGRRPHYTPDDDDRYVDVPDQTNIAAAMKLTGKTEKGLSIGILNAVTTKEHARIDEDGIGSKMTAEPFTNYFVGRAQRDYRGGDTRIGAIITSTNRQLNDDHLMDLPDGAYTGAFDFSHSWKDKTYYFDVKSVFSNVRGTTEAITDLQEAPQRYFQRPDADHVSLDENATSLSGHGGSVDFGKSGSGHIRFSTGFTWRSPGLELNDIGYLRESDKAMQHVWIQYREWEPTWIFRSFGMNFNQWNGWNFSREKIFAGGNINFHSQLKNYWSFGFGIGRNFGGLSKNSMRGGGLLRNEGSFNGWLWFNTDGRKAWQINYNSGFWKSQDGYSDNVNFGPGVRWRPNDAMSLYTRMNLNLSKRDMQYITNEELDNDEKRYIFGRMKQRTLGIVFRLDYAVTPDLTVQFYGQPFISAGKYNNLKMITNPRAREYSDRFRLYQAGELSYDADENEYTVTESGQEYSFGNPDYNFFQFISNLVVRWEYMPGSTIYMVWAQNRTGDDETGLFRFRNNMSDLFNIYPENVFLIKINRWFSL